MNCKECDGKMSEPCVTCGTAICSNCNGDGDRDLRGELTAATARAEQAEAKLAEAERTLGDLRLELECTRDGTILHATEDAAGELRCERDSARHERDIAAKREPTQAEGDAHEGATHPDGKTFPAGECFVPLGGWTGRRCIYCRQWTWGGPTSCLACVERSERRRLCVEIGNAEEKRDAAIARCERLVVALSYIRDAIGPHASTSSEHILYRKASAALSEPSVRVELPAVSWQNGGGPNECEHGYAAGLPCPECDAAKGPPRLEPHGPMPAVVPVGFSGPPSNPTTLGVVWRGETQPTPEVLTAAMGVRGQPAGERRFEGSVFRDGNTANLYTDSKVSCDLDWLADLDGHHVTIIVRARGLASAAQKEGGDG